MKEPLRANKALLSKNRVHEWCLLFSQNVSFIFTDIHKTVESCLPESVYVSQPVETVRSWLDRYRHVLFRWTKTCPLASGQVVILAETPLWSLAKNSQGMPVCVPVYNKPPGWCLVTAFTPE